MSVDLSIFLLNEAIMNEEKLMKTDPVEFTADELKQIDNALEHPENFDFHRVKEGSEAAKHLPVGSVYATEKSSGVKCLTCGSKNEETCTCSDRNEPIITNELGSKQSDIGEGWKLIDAMAIQGLSGSSTSTALPILSEAIRVISLQTVTKYKDIEEIQKTIRHLCNASDLTLHLEIIARVLEYGAKKYAVDNWRGISVLDHLEHAYRHLLLYSIKEEKEDLEHCHCRLHMALAKALRPDYMGQFVPAKPQAMDVAGETL